MDDSLDQKRASSDTHFSIANYLHYTYELWLPKSWEDRDDFDAIMDSFGKTLEEVSNDLKGRTKGIGHCLVAENRASEYKYFFRYTTQVFLHPRSDGDSVPCKLEGARTEGEIKGFARAWNDKVESDRKETTEPGTE